MYETDRVSVLPYSWQHIFWNRNVLCINLERHSSWPHQLSIFLQLNLQSESIPTPQKFDVHSPGELEPEVVKQKWKIHSFSSPNFCLFRIQSQITFRYIVVITSVICFCPSQNRNTQCIQECIFIKILVIKHNLSHITQPTGEIMQYGAGQLPKQWYSNVKSLEMSSSFLLTITPMTQ